MVAAKVLLLALVVAVAAASVKPEWIRVPGGKLVWHECAREVPVGSKVLDMPENDYLLITLPNGVEERMPRCKHTKQQKEHVARDRVNVQGWQVWTQYNSLGNTTFNSMTNYFTTPSAPLEWNLVPEVGIVYIFPGLQNDDWVPIQGVGLSDAPPGFDIIQPVIQYGGGSANGGGKFWELANWYVTLDDDPSALWTTATRIKEGDEIFGNMTKTGSQSWYIGAIVTRTGEVNGFEVTKPRLSVQNWAFVTLETYDIFQCSYYPPKGASSKFYDIVLTDKNGKVEQAKWDALEGPNQCGVGIAVRDSATVDINFN